MMVWLKIVCSLSGEGNHNHRWWGHLNPACFFLKIQTFRPLRQRGCKKMDICACGQATNDPPGGISTTYPILS